MIDWLGRTTEMRPDEAHSTLVNIESTLGNVGFERVLEVDIVRQPWLVSRLDPQRGLFAEQAFPVAKVKYDEIIFRRPGDQVNGFRETEFEVAGVEDESAGIQELQLASYETFLSQFAEACAHASADGNVVKKISAKYFEGMLVLGIVRDRPEWLADGRLALSMSLMREPTVDRPEAVIEQRDRQAGARYRSRCWHGVGGSDPGREHDGPLTSEVAMRQIARRVGAVGAGCAVAASLAVTAQAAPAVSASAWRVVFRARLAASNVITSLAAIRPDDAWAIGVITTDRVTSRLGYAMRWNGRSWHMLALPERFYPVTVLASAPGNVWVAGDQYQPGTNIAQHSALRWQGTRWQRVPLPPASSVVLAVGAASAWAIGGGQYTQGQGWNFHSYYWDGSTWADRPLPALGPYPALAASPGGGVWAFGTSAAAQWPKDGRLSAFRWAATGWREAPIPHPVTYCGCVTAAAGSPSSIWLTTVSTTANRYGTRHFVFWHWNGKTLTRLPPPTGGTGPEGPPPVPDGHGGAWFGPFAHWAGRWHFPGHCLGTGPSLAVSPVPGTRAAWGALDCQTNARPIEGAIDVTGPLP